MSGSIAFSQIPPNLRVPLFYAEFTTTNTGVGQPVQRTLIIGQPTTTVSGLPAFVPSAAQAAQTYGAGSQLALKIAAYRASDPTGEVWALPVPDATGATAASGTIVITGTATQNGTLFIYIGGTLVPVGVTNGQSATAVAAAVAAAVTAMPSLPVSATVAAGTVTLTALNKGTLGNDIPIMLNYLGTQGGQSTPAGIGVAVTQMTGGATDPTLTAPLALLGTTTFDFIVNPYPNSTALGATSALLSDQSGRWNYSSQLYGHAFSAVRDTVTNLETLGATFNDQHLTILGVNDASPSPGWLWAAAYVGAIAPSIKAQPNRPVQTLAIAGVLPEPAGFEIGFASQQALLTAGIALATRTPSGGAQMVRAVTTYQTNGFGQPDQSYLDTETLFTCMYVVRTLKGAVTQKFPRALLADDGTRLAPTPTGDTPVVVTPSIVKGELIAQYAIMAAANIVQDATAFAAGLIVQRNANDNSRLDVLYDPYYVSGLRIFAVLNQFAFQAQQAAA